jgi:hypothetical protein
MISFCEYQAFQDRNTDEQFYLTCVNASHNFVIMNN